MDSTAHAPAQRSFTVGELFTKGWEVTKKYWAKYLLLIAALILLSVAITFITMIVQNDIWNIVWQLVSFVVQLVVGLAAVRFVLLAVDGKPVVFSELVTTKDGMLLL